MKIFLTCILLTCIPILSKAQSGILTQSPYDPTDYVFDAYETLDGKSSFVITENKNSKTMTIHYFENGIKVSSNPVEHEFFLDGGTRTYIANGSSDFSLIFVGDPSGFEVKAGRIPLISESKTIKESSFFIGGQQVAVKHERIDFSNSPNSKLIRILSNLDDFKNGKSLEKSPPNIREECRKYLGQIWKLLIR